MTPSQTWYGGVTCLAWSGDERLVAAGGEDDLVHVYSVPDDSLVAVCRGHASWVAAVAFDPRPGPGVPEEGGGEGQAEYRLASVGDDGRLCVWHLRCSPSQKPRSEAGHIAWAPQRQRRRSELPYAEPSLRTRFAGRVVDSSFCLSLAKESSTMLVLLPPQSERGAAVQYSAGRARRGADHKSRWYAELSTKNGSGPRRAPLRRGG